MNIAIAEDSAFFIANIENIVTNLIPEANISHYNTISELMEKLNGVTCDTEILILDLNFEDGNVLSYISKIINDHENLQIIVISGQSSIRIALQTLDAGAKYYICKAESFNADLLQAINNVKENIKLKKQNNVFKNNLFNPDNFLMATFKLSTAGIDLISKDFDAFPESLTITVEEFLMNLGINFFMILRGGNIYHEGVFVLPAGSSQFYNVLMFAARIPDENAEDVRLKLGLFQFCLFISASIVPLIPSHEELSFIVDYLKDKISDANKITENLLREIKFEIIDFIKDRAVI